MGLALCMAVSLNAQQMTAAKIVFKNAGPFAQADLEAVAGVHPGETVVLKDLQAAAQRLADTGCFEDVHVDSSGSPKALTVIFILRSAITGDLHPAVFENFVWFTPEELQAVVHKSAPLFAASSALPETSNVLDAVSAELQAALASKGVAGADVGHRLVLATDAQPETTVNFRVNAPSTPVSSVNLTGVSKDLAPAVGAIARKKRGAPYVSGTGPGSLSESVLRPFFDAGYIDVKLINEKATPGPASGGAVPMALSATVESGEAYKVSALSFNGTEVMSAEAFASGAKLHAGEIASRTLLLESERPLDAAYHKLGYMDAYVNTEASKNAAAHTVSYGLHMVPGALFRLHSVSVQGLSPEARAQFDQAWKMKPGDPYNPDYVPDFLGNNTAMRQLAGYAGTFQAAADPSTHLVDLTVTFQPMPAH